VVAQNRNPPEEDARPLTPAVAVELEGALRAAMTSPSRDASERLSRAVKAAGADARAHSLRPEDLLRIFRALEDRIEADWKPSDKESGFSIRHRTIRVMLEAYYAG